MMAQKVIWEEEGPRNPASGEAIPMIRRSALFIHEMGDLVIEAEGEKLTVFSDPKFLDDKPMPKPVRVPAELLNDAKEALILRAQAKAFTIKADELLALNAHHADLFKPD